MYKKILIFIVVLAIVSVSVIGVIYKKYISYSYKFIPRWSIGVANYDGEINSDTNEYALAFTKDNILYDNSCFVADPYVLKTDSLYYMFYENGIATENYWKGVINLAVSKDKVNWKDCGTIINEKNTIAFPIVYKNDNDYYMTIDSSGLGELIIYKALEFPNKWACVDTLIHGEWSDPVIHYEKGRYYLFTSERYTHNAHLFTSDDILGPYKEHPDSPIVMNNKAVGRNAGKIFSYKGNTYRPVQDCSELYGKQVRLLRIETLNENDYIENEEKNSPVLIPNGDSWYSKKMHTFNVIETEGDKISFIIDGTYVDYDKTLVVRKRL